MAPAVWMHPTSPCGHVDPAGHGAGRVGAFIAAVATVGESTGTGVDANG
jgi:hypothetical protein